MLVPGKIYNLVACGARSSNIDGRPTPLDERPTIIRDQRIARPFRCYSFRDCQQDLSFVWVVMIGYLATQNLWVFIRQNGDSDLCEVTQTCNMILPKEYTSLCVVGDMLDAASSTSFSEKLMSNNSGAVQRMVPHMRDDVGDVDPVSSLNCTDSPKSAIHARPCSLIRILDCLLSE